MRGGSKRDHTIERAARDAANQPRLRFCIRATWPIRDAKFPRWAATHALLSGRVGLFAAPHGVNPVLEVRSLAVPIEVGPALPSTAREVLELQSPATFGMDLGVIRYFFLACYVTRMVPPIKGCSPKGRSVHTQNTRIRASPNRSETSLGFQGQAVRHWR